MSIPNSLSALRIVLTPVFALLLFADSPSFKFLSLGVFIVAALTDWYDGRIARKYGGATRIGKFLDPLADKILSSTALFSFVYLNLVDAWMVWIIVVRDFLITGLRSFAEWRNMPIVTSRSAQAKTFGEFIIIYYILILYVLRSVPILRSQYGAWFDDLMHPRVLFGMMLLVTLSTIGTGVMYLIDNRAFLRELYGALTAASEG
jgi:CDP-diacylglycerol--glycerol-3-phosphate 3-phosphatidyltransferase